MTDRPRMSDTDLRTFQSIAGRAPLRHSLAYHRSTPITDVGGVLDWLAAYVSHVDTHITKHREEDRARARAATVLRGLRPALDNAVSTLADLDAAVDAGILPAEPLIPGDDDE